jgi:defect-in-organelle-trafficking protein DotD
MEGDGNGTSQLAARRGAGGTVRGTAPPDARRPELAHSRVARGHGGRVRQRRLGLDGTRPATAAGPPRRPGAAASAGQDRQRLMAMRRAVAPALISAVLAAGCAGVNPVPTTVAIPGMPNPEEALRQSMQHVDAEMAELGHLSPTVARQVQPVMPSDLQRVVSFEWSGPLDQAVAKLSASIGYTFYTTAPANAQPLDVAIRLSSVPAYQVFQTLGAEAGTRATVQVNPLHHQVQVIHHV